MLHRTAFRIGALFIGVNNGLRLAENDAHDLSTLWSSGAGPFRAEGARALVGWNATTQAVDTALVDMASERADIVVLGFAGHARSEGILLAGRELYPYATLLQRLRETGARRQLVIIDACNAGAFAKLAAARVAGLGRIEHLTDASWIEAARRWNPGLRIVASARAHENAHESTHPNARNSYFTASLLAHARTLAADLADGFVSDVALVEAVRHDLRARRLPQTPVVWGRASPVPVLRSERERVLGRASISSVQTRGADLIVQVGTANRRFLPTYVHTSVRSQLTGVTADCCTVFAPAASLAIDPVRVNAGAILLDDWHLALAGEGYTLEWHVRVTDSWGRVLTHWSDAICYRAA